MSAVEDLNQERRITFCLYEYWEKLAGESGLPALKNMNRDEIAPFKKNLVLIDLRNGHHQPTFQVIGQDLQEDLENDLTNKPVNDVPRRTMLSRVTDHYLEVLANRVPIAFEAEFVNRNSEKALYRGILLPFSDDDQNINFILGGVRWILESEVTLDDSKPTIEELMKTISAGREDQPTQLEEEKIAAEHTGDEATAEELTPAEDDFNIDEGASVAEEKTTSLDIDDNFEETAPESASPEDAFENNAPDQEELTSDLSTEDDILDLTDEVEVDEIIEEDAEEVDNIQVSPEADELEFEEEALLEEIENSEELLDEAEVLLEQDLEFDTPITESDEFETVEETSVHDKDTSVSEDDQPINNGPSLVRKTFFPEEEVIEAEEISEVITDALDLTDNIDTDSEIKMDVPEQEDVLVLENDDDLTLDEEPVEEKLETELAPDMSFKDIVEEQLIEKVPSFSEEQDPAIDVEEASNEQDEMLVAEAATVDTPDDLEKPTTIEELLRSADDDLELVDEDVSDILALPENDDTSEDSTETLLESLEAETLSEGRDVEAEEIETQDMTAEMPETPEISDIDDIIIEPVAIEDPIEETEIAEAIQEDTSGIDDTSNDDLSIDQLMQSIIAERKFDPAHKPGTETGEDKVIVEGPVAEEITDEVALDDPEIIEEAPAEDIVTFEADLYEKETIETDEAPLTEEVLDNALSEDETTDEFVTENVEEPNAFEIELDEEQNTPDEELISLTATTPFINVDEEPAFDDADDDLQIEVSEEETPLTEDTADEAIDDNENVDLEEPVFVAEASDTLTENPDNGDDTLTFEEDVILVDEVALSTDETSNQDIIELEEPVITEPQTAEQENLSEIAEAPETNEAPTKKRRRGSVIERAMERMVPSFGIKPFIQEEPLVVGAVDNVENSDEPQQANPEATQVEEPLDKPTAELDSSEEAVLDDPASNEIIEELIEDDVVHPIDELVQEILTEQTPASQENADVLEDEIIEDEYVESDFTDEDDVEEEFTDEKVTGESVESKNNTEETHSLTELRTTLKQIIGYIKKEDANHNRSRDSLYNILTAIYEFHNTCEQSPTAYDALVNENDLKVQSRAPFTPVLKICLGKDYDKTRLTEYAAALGIARYMNVEVSEFHAFIKNFPGGIKGCVKEMRIIRKHGASGNIMARKTRSVEEAREILRDMAPIASFRLKKVIVGNNIDEFCLLLAKRDGHDISVLKILDDKYTKLDPILKRAAFIKGNLNDRK